MRQPVNYNVDVLFTFQHKHPESYTLFHMNPVITELEKLNIVAIIPCHRVEAEIGSGVDTAEVEADEASLAPVAEGAAPADAPHNGSGGAEGDRASPNPASVFYI